jgi:Ribbon-helix-helix protein, copG family
MVRDVWCTPDHQWEQHMRTTLSIDDDILAAAKHLAAREHKSVGEVISALARQGLARSSRAPKVERNGIPLLPSRKRATPITLELVNRLRDEQP